MRLHGTRWCDKLRPNAPEEFAERIFYAVGHTLCTAFGGWVCLKNGWLTWPGELFFVLPFPHALPPEQLAVTRAYFALESSFHLESAFHLLRILLARGATREVMMLLHHTVTLLLIGGSWSVIGLPETGAVVLWLHAASDIFIDLLKACDSLKWDAPLVPCYLLALLGWVAFRFVFLPYHLLRPGWAQIAAIATGTCPPYPDCGPYGMHVPEMLAGTACWLGLVLLLCMHTVWLKQLLRKGLRQLSGGPRTKAAERPDTCALEAAGAATDKPKRS